MDGYIQVGNVSLAIEFAGDMTLTSDYWDCDCDGRPDDDYIKSADEPVCARCGSERDESADSRLDEALVHLDLPALSVWR